MKHSTADEGAHPLPDFQVELASQAATNPLDAKLVGLAASRTNLLETIMETVPVGVVIADASGRILHGNKRVSEMVRHPVLHSENTDSYGEWISFHEDGRRVKSEEYPLSRVLVDGEDRATLDVEYQRGDGTRFWMRIIGQPVKDAEGKTIGATVALIDIDEQRRLQKMQDVLIAELNHRVKNAFSVVKSIVAQSLRGAAVPDGLKETLDARLNAYANAHSRLVGGQWEEADLSSIAHEILERIGGQRISISGPDIKFPTRVALSLSMAFYELATNAVKYGALSNDTGSVDLSWEFRDFDEKSTLVVSWTEKNGPKCLEPNRTGFGSFITTRALCAETGGKVSAEYKPEGLSWSLIMPVNTKSD